MPLPDPRTGHAAAGIYRSIGSRGSVAAHGPSATAGHAGDRLSERAVARLRCALGCSIRPGSERNRLCRGPRRQFDRLRVMAAELVGRRVAAIFAAGMDADIRGVRAVITTTSSVFATGGDPVGLGLVESFNRPGGNATAVTVIAAALMPKRLEVVRELVVFVTFVAVLINPNDANAASYTRDAQAAADTLGLKVLIVQAATEGDFAPAFATLANARANALLVPVNTLFITKREKLIALAASYAIPAMFDRRDFPAAGGLMSYGASITEQYRHGGVYIGKILRGAKPADLPVLQPTSFELVINLKTAKALGLAVPANLIARADEVID